MLVHGAMIAGWMLLIDRGLRASVWEVIPVILMPFVVFAMTALCGMVIRRGITAGLVAVMALVGLVVVAAPLARMSMLPEALLPTVPLVLLAVTWAWSRDWILETPGPGRWLRLAVLLATAGGVVFAVHVGSRVWGVPDVSPGFDRGRRSSRAYAVDEAGGRTRRPRYREASRRPDSEEDQKAWDKRASCLKRANSRARRAGSWRGISRSAGSVSCWRGRDERARRRLLEPIRRPGRCRVASSSGSTGRGRDLASLTREHVGALSGIRGLGRRASRRRHGRVRGDARRGPGTTCAWSCSG